MLMKIKIDFIPGELSVITLKGVLDAVEQSVETSGQPVLSRNFKQSTGCGKNQLVPLFLNTNNQTSTKKETWMSKNSGFGIANSELQDAVIVELWKNEGFSNNDNEISALFPNETWIGLGTRELESRCFSLSIPTIQRKSKLREKSSKTPEQWTFAGRTNAVLPNIKTRLTLRWLIKNR